MRLAAFGFVFFCFLGEKKIPKSFSRPKLLNLSGIAGQTGREIWIHLRHAKADFFFYCRQVHFFSVRFDKYLQILFFVFYFGRGIERGANEFFSRRTLGFLVYIFNKPRLICIFFLCLWSPSPEWIPVLSSWFDFFFLHGILVLFFAFAPSTRRLLRAISSLFPCGNL